MEILDYNRDFEILKNYLSEDAFKKEIQKYDFSGKRVLSLGCGLGKWENIIYHLCSPKSVTGIDANSEVVKKASDTYKDVTFIVKDYMYLTSDFVEQFDVIIWIPGPGLNMFKVITGIFSSLRKNRIDLLLWPGNTNFSTFYTKPFDDFLAKHKVTDYNREEYTMYAGEKASSFSDEEYDTMIRMMTKSICKFEKCGRLIRLYDFNNKDLEETARCQKAVIDLYKVKESIDKVKKNNFVFNGIYMSNRELKLK